MVPNVMSGPRKMFGLPRRLLRRSRLRFAQRSAGTYRGKIFCVGKNKTGTTSLEYVFRRLGYKVAPQWEGERFMAHSQLNPTEDFWRWVERYEVFQDAPFSWTWMLDEVYARYPGAKFILTLRDEVDWFESVKNHHFEHLKLMPAATDPEIAAAMKSDSYIRRGYFYDQHCRNHPSATVSGFYDADVHKRTFRDHNAYVRERIRANQLLALSVSEEPTTEAICRFLDLPKNFIKPMPVLNQRRVKE